MQANLTILDEKDKEELQKKLLNTILDGVSNNSLDLKTMKQAAAYVLDNIDKVHNDNDLILMLQHLSKWNPSFEKLLTQYKYKGTELREKEVMQKLSSYIKTLN